MARLNRKRVVLVGDGRKMGVREAAKRARQWLAKRVDLIGFDLEGELDLSKACADLLVVFGGDGFILQTARRLGGNQVPVFGVNFGKFGFLAETVEDEFEADLERILSNEIVPSERMMLSALVRRGGKPIENYLAFNDVVLNRPSVSRMIHIKLLVDSEEVTTYACDGLIVSSPVGSTAHSLSAGGPILFPTMEALIVTPICPHTLSNRPLVLPGNKTLTLVLVASFAPSTLTVDGQVSLEVVEGDTVEVTKSSKPFLLVETGKRTYFDILRAKMGWSGRMVPGS